MFGLVLDWKTDMFIMIYKFPKPNNLFKRLLPSYKGEYIQMCVPGADDEKCCYVELTEKQFPIFTEHFGDNGVELDKDSDEYPASRQSKTSNRIEKFWIVRPHINQNRFN